MLEVMVRLLALARLWHSRRAVAAARCDPAAATPIVATAAAARRGATTGALAR